jgi:hypothetical protein
VIRINNWPLKLHEFIVAMRDEKFSWGVRDCGQFAGSWILAATGIDVAAAYRGKYHDEAGAEALFLNRHLDLGSFAAAIALENGMPEVAPVTCAQRGDVVWVDNSTLLNPSLYGALGVVSLDGRYAVCMSDKGVKRVHMQRWKRAWRV